MTKKKLLSCGLPKFNIYDKNIVTTLSFEGLTQRDLVTIDLLRNSPEQMYYLHQLNSRYRKKIEPYLADITLDIKNELLLKVRELALTFEISI